MSKVITLESIHELLSGFISRQEAFNSKQEAFNSKQEAFNTRLEDRLDRFQEEEKANHNLSHRMIMQSFEAISEVRRDIDERDKPWLHQK